MSRHAAAGAPGAPVRYRPSRAGRALFGPPMELVVTRSHLGVGPASIPLARVLYADLVERPPHRPYAAVNASVALLFLSALFRGTMTPPYALLCAACSTLVAGVWMLPQASLEVHLYADPLPPGLFPSEPAPGLPIARTNGPRGPRLQASYRVWGRPPGLRAIARAVDHALPWAHLEAVGGRADATRRDADSRP